MKQQLQILGLCLTLIIGFNFTANAQFSGGLGYLHVQPLDDFKENVSKSSKGVYMQGLQRVSNSNLHVGGLFGITMYAKEVYDVEFDGYNIKVEEEDCFLQYQFMARYYAWDKMVTPYVEGRVGGMSFFSTEYAVEEEVAETYEGSGQFHGTSLITSIGGGFVVKIPRTPISIDFNVNGNKGTHTEYRDIEGVSYRRNLDDGIKASRTNSVSYQVGIILGM